MFPVPAAGERQNDQTYRSARRTRHRIASCVRRTLGDQAQAASPLCRKSRHQRTPRRWSSLGARHTPVDKTIQTILRHSSVQTTREIYIKGVDGDAVAAMKRLQIAIQSGARTDEYETSMQP